MKTFLFSLNTSTIQPTPLMEKIRLAGKHGFDGIELWLNDVFEYIEGGGSVEDVTKAVRDQGLMLPCSIAMKGWVEASEEQYPRALEECRRRLDLATRLGAPFVAATPSRGPADLGLITRRFKDLLDIGRQIGAMPTMEYLGFCKSVYRIDQAWQIVLDTGDPDATILLDSFHTYRGGSSLSDLDPIPAARIANYHLDDAPNDPPREEQLDPDRVMPGDGILDLPAEAGILRDKGYTGSISLELFNRSLWEKDPDEVLAVGIERMRELFG